MTDRPYVVRRLGASVALNVVALAGFVVLALVLFDVPRLFVGVAVVVALVQAWGASLVLRVDQAGVRMGARRFVPWESIEAVVAAEEEVGVRLRRGAPLPRGVRGVIHDPEGLGPVVARAAVPGLDRAALGTAVAAFGRGAALDHDPGRR